MSDRYRIQAYMPDTKRWMYISKKDADFSDENKAIEYAQYFNNIVGHPVRVVPYDLSRSGGHSVKPPINPFPGEPLPPDFWRWPAMISFGNPMTYDVIVPRINAYRYDSDTRTWAPVAKYDSINKIHYAHNHIENSSEPIHITFQSKGGLGKTTRDFNNPGDIPFFISPHSTISVDNIDAYDVFGCDDVEMDVWNAKELLRDSMYGWKRNENNDIDKITGTWRVRVESFPAELREWLEEYGKEVNPDYYRVYDFSGPDLDVRTIPYTQYYTNTKKNPHTGEIIYREGEIKTGEEAVFNIRKLKRERKDLLDKLQFYVTNPHPPLQLDPFEMTLSISNHPNDIMKKSSCQPWWSCEQVGGEYGGGEGEDDSAIYDSDCYNDCIGEMVQEYCYDEYPEIDSSDIDEDEAIEHAIESGVSVSIQDEFILWDDLDPSDFGVDDIDEADMDDVYEFVGSDMDSYYDLYGHLEANPNDLEPYIESLLESKQYDREINYEQCIDYTDGGDVDPYGECYDNCRDEGAGSRDQCGWCDDVENRNGIAILAYAGEKDWVARTMLRQATCDITAVEDKGDYEKEYKKCLSEHSKKLLIQRMKNTDETIRRLHQRMSKATDPYDKEQYSRRIKEEREEMEKLHYLKMQVQSDCENMTDSQFREHNDQIWVERLYNRCYDDADTCPEEYFGAPLANMLGDIMVEAGVRDPAMDYYKYEGRCKLKHRYTGYLDYMDYRGGEIGVRTSSTHKSDLLSKKWGTGARWCIVEPGEETCELHD